MDINKETVISLLQTEGFIPVYFSSISDLDTLLLNPSENQKTLRVFNFEVNSSSIPPELFPESASDKTLIKIRTDRHFDDSQDEFHRYLQNLWPRFVFRAFGRSTNSPSPLWTTIQIRQPILLVVHGRSSSGKSSAVRSLTSLKSISCDYEISSLENIDSCEWDELKEAAMVGLSEHNVGQAIHSIHDRKLFSELVSFLLRDVNPSENLILDLYMTLDMHGDFLAAAKKFNYKVYFVQNADDNYSELSRITTERNNLIDSVAAISQQRDLAIAERDRVLNSRIWKMMRLYKKLKNFSKIR